MKLLKEVENRFQGLTFHTVKTDKYKTNTLILKLKAPLKREFVTLRALLPYVLQSGTKTYPSSTQLRTYLDDLYGATLHVDLSKKGEEHIITIRIEVANETFLSDPTPLFTKAIDLLADILLSPALQNDIFVEETVEKEKRTLKQRIQSVYDDKMRYSNLRLVQEMCANEPYSLHVNGEMEEIDRITAQSLFEYYKQVIMEDQIDLYVIGNVNEDEVLNAAQKSFQLQNRQEPRYEAPVSKKVTNVNEVIEEQDVKQGKLNIGYRTNTTYRDNDYYALQVFNGIFGGFSHSKLFLNVREKESLAYYAASRFESHKGILMVMSGVEFKNYERAVSIIKEQMDAMKKGDFTDQEVSQTKAVIRNQVLETIDTARGLAEILYHNVVSDKKRPMSEWIEGINAVTKEEIISVAQKVELDTIYFLKGLEADK